MKKYVAVLGRQPLISVAELESLFGDVRLVAPSLAEFTTDKDPNVHRLGGTLKIGEPVTCPLPEFLHNLPSEGKITLGLSDFSRKATPFLAQKEALRLKRILVKSGRSVRVVPNQSTVLSSATSLHNHLFGGNKIEILKNGQHFYHVTQVQNIEAYVERDRARPARDAKVGMLPPKLAQILLNLCGDLPEESRILDPFCGTGVVLQEAVLMGYQPYGTDLNERMVEYTKKNLKWLYAKKQTIKTLATKASSALDDSIVAQIEENVKRGDATSFRWDAPITAVACETYLGPPMSQPPAEIKLRQARQECKAIILGFLKNLSEQIEPGTAVVIAVPAWLRPDQHYERLNLLDEIKNLRYNVISFKNLGQKDLLYHRDGQIVAREIIVLRKK